MLKQYTSKLTACVAAIAISGITLFSPNAAAATNFKIAVSGTQSGGQYLTAKEFAEQLENLKDGAYTATLYPNSQLGGEQATVNDVAMGMLDLTIVATNNISPFAPTLGVLSLPYLIQTEEEAKTLTESDYMLNELIPQVIEESGVR